MPYTSTREYVIRYYLSPNSVDWRTAATLERCLCVYLTILTTP